jgi:hypothetical protein
MDPTELFPWLFGGSMALTVTLVLASVCVSLLCTILPLAVVFRLVRNRSQQSRAAVQASQTWPTTAGLVLKSRVEVSGGNYTSVSPHVLYEYDVDGRTYQSAQIRAGDRYMRSSSEREAYDTVDRYPEGAVVTVYYNPTNPSESALER